MIAVDTNILVYAHREDSPWHESAFQNLKNLVEGPIPWAIPWPCLHEFLAIVTHPRIFNPSTPVNLACQQIEAWLEAPHLVLLAESNDYWPILQQVVKEGKIQGPTIHDARIAALCQHYGIQELWTADRDFSRFPNLAPHNPLVQ